MQRPQSELAAQVLQVAVPTTQAVVKGLVDHSLLRPVGWYFITTMEYILYSSFELETEYALQV
jgi:hypothetical protein